MVKIKLSDRFVRQYEVRRRDAYDVLAISVTDGYLIRADKVYGEAAKDVVREYIPPFTHEEFMNQKGFLWVARRDRTALYENNKMALHCLKKDAK